MFRWSTILIALLLAGCFASDNAQQNVQPQAQAAAQPDDDAACQAQGFQPGSTDYVQCRKRFDSQHLKDNSSWTPERESVARGLLGRPPSGF
jgi:hypothetical protein